MNHERLPHDEVILDAAVEVRKPTMFGELIIAVVYLPVLPLQGTEGKLFRPMALTVLFALAGSLVLSLTLMPVLATIALPKKMSEKEVWLIRVHQMVLSSADARARCSRHRVLTMLAALVVVRRQHSRGAAPGRRIHAPARRRGPADRERCGCRRPRSKSSIAMTTQIEKLLLKNSPRSKPSSARPGVRRLPPTSWESTRPTCG